MPDTSAARAAIREAYEHHRDVMGGMSMALLKMEAAGGLCRPDPRFPDDPPLPFPEDSLVWTDHALAGLDDASRACDKLKAAILAAAGVVAAVNREDAQR